MLANRRLLRVYPRRLEGGSVPEGIAARLGEFKFQLDFTGDELPVEWGVRRNREFEVRLISLTRAMATEPINR